MFYTVLILIERRIFPELVSRILGGRTVTLTSFHKSVLPGGIT